jgi:hypothetical protein
MKEIRILPLHCQRCKKDFYPSLDSKTGKTTEQKKCPICNNKYWKSKVTRKTVSKMLKS